MSAPNGRPDGDSLAPAAAAPGAGESPGAEVPTPAPLASPLGGFLREFAESRVAVLAVVVLGSIILMAIAAPLIAPQNPYDLATLVLTDARRPPGFVGSRGFTHWLGTDAQGRDLWSAILYGLGISLQVGLMAGAIAFSVGASLGTLAGFVGGRIETLIMRVIDLQLSFPAILLALVLAAVLGQGKWQLIAALVTAQYAYFARTAHGAFRHVLPNCLPPLIVVATVQVANSIALEATLSFLGLGLPVSEPSLGMLIANGFQYMLSGRYWISIYPGVALIVLIVAINLVGDQIRDQLNPRLQR